MKNQLALPSFIIAGAPRCGTTWLYSLLDQHPDVYMACPVQPEPKFFLIDETYNKGIKYYSDTWFKDASSSQLCGEKSTNYLESPVAAQRIHEHLPTGKLIFILRDPVDRALSNYFWSKQNSMEQQDFASALELEEDREQNIPAGLKYSRPHAYFSRGLYAEHLEPYFSLFPSQQILCLRFEDIATDSHELTAKVHHFLNIPFRPQDSDHLGTVNPSKHDRRQVHSIALLNLKERYLAPNRRLAKLLGPEFNIWV